MEKTAENTGQGSGCSDANCSLSLSDLVVIKEALKAGSDCAKASLLNTTYHERIINEAVNILLANAQEHPPLGLGGSNCSTSQGMSKTPQEKNKTIFTLIDKGVQRDKLEITGIIQTNRKSI